MFKSQQYQNLNFHKPKKRQNHLFRHSDVSNNPNPQKYELLLNNLDRLSGVVLSILLVLISSVVYYQFKVSLNSKKEFGCQREDDITPNVSFLQPEVLSCERISELNNR